MPEPLKHILDRFTSGWLKTVDVGPGWHWIVIDLDRDIAKLHPDYKIHCIKEKFGGLRFYCECEAEPEVEKLIAVAALTAAVTCEQCGREGKLRTGGWIKTLCDECFTPGIR